MRESEYNRVIGRATGRRDATLPVALTVPTPAAVMTPTPSVLRESEAEGLVDLIAQAPAPDRRFFHTCR